MEGTGFPLHSHRVPGPAQERSVIQLGPLKEQLY
jgi:hypothetical protein